jgi:hypothetical protein
VVKFDSVRAFRVTLWDIVNPTASRSGSDVVIAWTTDPAAGDVDIWTVEGPANVDVYSIDPTDWTLEFNINDGSSSINEMGDVGNGQQKYYKVMSDGQALTAASLQTDVIGKFDIHVSTNPADFFFSIPVSPASSAIADVFGTQVTDLDSVFTFNINNDVQENAQFHSGTGTWTLWTDPGQPATIQIQPGRAYGYWAQAERDLTVVGQVLNNNFSWNLSGGGGVPTIANWIGTAFPLTTALTNSGLDSASVGTDITNSGNIYFFNSTADVQDWANQTGANVWSNALNPGDPALTLRPGRGYMFTEPIQATFTWTQPKP